MGLSKESLQHIATGITDSFIQTYCSLSAAGMVHDSVYRRFTQEIQIYNGGPHERASLAVLLRQNLDSHRKGDATVNFSFAHVTIHLDRDIIVGRYLADLDYFTKSHSNAKEL